MIKKLFKKLNGKLKERKGASMAIVITTMSLLIIMGTSFSTMAYNAYRHSYGTICRQQAMYTAKSILDGFVDEFVDNGTLRTHVGNALFAQVNKEENKNKKITEVAAEINISGLHNLMIDKNNVSGEDNTSDCKMYVSYSDNTRSKLRLLVSARYKGFENSLSVILGYTNKASVELSKIMSNTMFFTSPIVDLMYYVDKDKTNPFTDFAIDGDVYIDKPHKQENGPDPYKTIKAVPNIDGAKWIAENGHTLMINNEGRVNIAIGEDGFPLPRLDENGNKIYKYDDKGQLIPMRDYHGNIIPDEGEKEAYLLNSSLYDYIYGAGYEKDKDNKIIPYIDIRRENDNNNGQIINSVNKNSQYYVEKELVKYVQNNNPGEQYNGKYDKLGRPILKTFIDFHEENDRWMVAMNKRGDGYDCFRAKQIHGEKDRYFFRWGDWATQWNWVEVYETIDPITLKTIWVTGRVKDGTKWVTNEYSFKKCEYEKDALDGSHRLRALDGNDKPISWAEAKNQTCYNVYLYQKTRNTTFIDISKPKYDYEYLNVPNEWSEVYLRSHYWGSIELTYPMPVVINGNLKCNTDVLLGLCNRSYRDRKKNGFVNGGAHEFKNPNTNEIVPVSFDSKRDDYTLAKHNVLSLTGDIFVNGDARGENLWVGGSIYAKDNDPSDDNDTDPFGWKNGCKGNIFLEQATYDRLGVNIGAYMVVKGDVVADGYVFIGGTAGDLVDKAEIFGDVHAGKYNSDGTPWGNRGISTPIPVNKFYDEDGKTPVEQFDLDANVDENGKKKDYFPGGIYGYRTATEENVYNKKNRYKLGQGDVVLQKTHIHGNVYATGDVYLSNGVWVDGDIYTPGNVYITKGDADTTLDISYDRDGRCRVLGNIYAGGDVAVTGACEIGDFKATKEGQVGYKSDIYCGGNFYSSGRIKEKNHDILTGSLYCKGNAYIAGNDKGNSSLELVEIREFSKLGYNDGNVFVGGDLYADSYVRLSNGQASIYVGGSMKITDNCAIDNHNPTYIEKNCYIDGGYVHTGKLFVGGNLDIGNTWYYLHDEFTQAYVLGNISQIGKSPTDAPTGNGTGTFNFWCNGTYEKMDKRFNDGCYVSNIGPSTIVNAYGEDKAVLGDDGKLSNSIKPQGWDLLNINDKTIKINESTYSNLTYFTHKAYENILLSYEPLKPTLKHYKDTVDAKIREWTPPDYNEKTYNEDYKGKGIDGTIKREGDNKISKFEDTPGHFIIDDSVFDMPVLTLANNQRLTIDTTKKNIHILLKSDLILGAGAKLEVKGANMAFIYFKEGSAAKKISLGEGSSFGESVGIDPGISKKHAGLHIVATQNDFTMEIKPDVTINSFNYMPRGVLDFELPRDETRDAVIANPAGSYVISRIQGMDLPTMDYWRIKFTSKDSPLILDINGDINYGDDPIEIKDFKGVEWVVVEYK